MTLLHAQHLNLLHLFSDKLHFPLEVVLGFVHILNTISVSKTSYPNTYRPFSHLLGVITGSDVDQRALRFGDLARHVHLVMKSICILTNDL